MNILHDIGLTVSYTSIRNKITNIVAKQEEKV